MHLLFYINLAAVTWAAGLQQRKTILVFGGNGFIGGETVVRLIENSHRVILINRGNWYWDSAVRVQPFVQHIKCDRMSTLNDCEEFTNFIRDEGDDVYFDVAIDFSGYHPFSVRNVMSIIGKRFGLYIYISTDSIYDVSAAKTHNDPTREEDAIRPTNPEDANPAEEYGDLKFQCEEVLVESVSLGGPPYIILRLPDVIGPRDNTKRWWIYQLWLKLDKYLDKHVSIPDHLVDKPISFVYVSDIADIVSNLIHADSTIHNQAFNIAFDETIALSELLGKIKRNLNQSDQSQTIPISSSNDSLYFYPSVLRGPVDTTKAKRMLNWTPTPLDIAISNTVQFYEHVIRDPNFMSRRNEIIQTITVYFSDDEKGRGMSQGVLTEYGVDLSKARDEL